MTVEWDDSQYQEFFRMLHAKVFAWEIHVSHLGRNTTEWLSTAMRVCDQHDTRLQELRWIIRGKKNEFDAIRETMLRAICKLAEELSFPLVLERLDLPEILECLVCQI
jgi:hypothetical protein